jgi:hypothetical protein
MNGRAGGREPVSGIELGRFEPGRTRASPDTACPADHVGAPDTLPGCAGKYQGNR